MITIDASSPVPVFDQICSQIDGLIRTGILPEGSKLPSVRQLAADLQIAPGTVKKAYDELQSRGLIDTGHGRAARVRPSQQVSEPVLEAANRLARAAKHNQLDLPSLSGILQVLWEFSETSGNKP